MTSAIPELMIILAHIRQGLIVQYRTAPASDKRKSHEVEPAVHYTAGNFLSVTNRNFSCYCNHNDTVCAVTVNTVTVHGVMNALNQGDAK